MGAATDYDQRPSAGGSSRARLTCTWKCCSYVAADDTAMRYAQSSPVGSMSPMLKVMMMINRVLRDHAVSHRRCPTSSCAWTAEKDQKEIDRHVWVDHRKWAKESGYPPMESQCDECARVYSRKDGLLRHKREVHGGNARIRGLRG